MEYKLSITRSVGKAATSFPVDSGVVITTSTSVGSKSKPLYPAWIFGVAFGLAFALVVLAVNFTSLVWVYTRFTVAANIAVIFTGVCSNIAAKTSRVELATNIFATGLLAASNNCAQLLASPTRAEVDNAHANGSWVNIGTPSIGNLWWVSRWRKVISVLLIVSSIPIHLVYNSVIFSSSYANDYIAVAVTENFIEGGFWNQTSALNRFTPDDPVTSQLILERITRLQTNARTLTRLENNDCLAAYSSASLESPYLSVLLVTNSTAQDSVLDGIYHQPEQGVSGQRWFSRIEVSKKPNPVTLLLQPTPCEAYDFGTASNWSIPECNCKMPGDLCEAPPVFISHCLAEPSNTFGEQCSISVNTTLLIVVIIFNSIKVICLGSILLAFNFRPLATVGDAISSFLSMPDATTKGYGALSISTMRKPLEEETFKKKIRSEESLFPPWSGKRYRWIHVVSSRFYMSILAMFLIIWLVFIVLMSQCWKEPLLRSWNHIDTNSTLFAHTAGPSLVANVLLVNAPQLLVAFMYLFFNFVITRMVTAHDLTKFALRSRTLRVSTPVGQQRSTYWLQLPYYYTIPLAITTAALQWLISRGLFFINIRIYDISGQEVPSRQHFAYSTGGLALLLAFILGTLILFSLVGLIFRRLGAGIPIMGTCSIAISAACHPAEGDEDAALRPLMYGVTDGQEDKLGLDHVCFSSNAVTPLMVGTSYC